MCFFPDEVGEEEEEEKRRAIGRTAVTVNTMSYSQVQLVPGTSSVLRACSRACCKLASKLLRRKELTSKLLRHCGSELISDN